MDCQYRVGNPVFDAYPSSGPKSGYSRLDAHHVLLYSPRGDSPVACVSVWLGLRSPSSIAADRMRLTLIRLTHSLISVTTIIQEVNRELGTGKRLDIKIKAFKPGSFGVSIELLGFVDAVKSLLTIENFNTARTLMKAVAGLFHVRQLLGPGKVESEPRQVVGGTYLNLEDSSGNTFNINNNIVQLTRQ